ncbi:AAA family ATPase [Paraliomyxa miuraensis]|uniref:AAA family ATPase n=1 Tax=Paraliomyxa miuraensis TaxID=376150 RepID=UPI002251DAE1|nr:AAA family ATPase [Paraliomyxa miuraensis]MCX4245058.1 ATP-binding protein [Paraliomyxa miuraensis]
MRLPGPGPSDFRQLREEGRFYVDKTAWIAELLHRPEQVVLLPRPRRFGKTLNLSALRYFIERSEEERRSLFEGLAIASAGPEVLEHQARHPVVALNLKDVGLPDLAGSIEALQGRIAEVCGAHRSLLDSAALSPEDHASFGRLLQGTASRAELRTSLQRLTRWLHAHHGERCVLLIDEYDAPIEAGFAHGYYDQIVDVLRGVLGGGLKDNPHLYRGVLTGVRRVAKESLFSGLNNVVVLSLLADPFRTSFGFTDQEVRTVLEAAGHVEHLDEVRRWYNGYVFGGAVVYNPWSVLSFAATGRARPYWVAPSSDHLLRTLFLAGGIDLAREVPVLLAGQCLRRALDEHVVLPDLERNPTAIWSFLVFAGYLKAEVVEDSPKGVVADVSIPNLEVDGLWRELFVRWLGERMHGIGQVDAVARALLEGDASTMAALLGDLVRDVLSVHDTGTGPTAPERVYHAFVLGLLAHLEPEHRVRSERESGYGRSDVLIIPRRPGQPGVVLELKRVLEDRGESPDAALASALQQIEARDYAAELRAAGAEPVRKVAIAFAGKRVWVRAE